MKNFTPKWLNLFKLAFFFLIFFTTSHLRAQTCAGLNSIYQTKGTAGNVEIYRYSLQTQSFVNIQTLTTGVSTDSGSASAFNSVTGLLYVKEDNSHVRVFNPAAGFAHVGRITLTGMGGLDIYANMFSEGNYIYFRDDNGLTNIGRFDVSILDLSSGFANAHVNNLSLSGTGYQGQICNDYAYYDGNFYGIHRNSGTATSCRLVIINQTTHVVTTRTLNLTNPNTGHNFAAATAFGAIWIDKKGNLLTFNNSTGNVYLIKDVDNASSTDISWVLPSGDSSSNDGFSCDGVDLFTPIVNITPPSCSVAGTATITNYLDDPNINYIFYDSLGNTVNYVSVGPGGVITGLLYGEEYTASLHIIDIDFTSSPSDPFMVLDILTPVVANVTPSSATTNCANPSIILTATGGVSYSWNPIAGLSDPNISNPTATPTNTTTYTVTVTGANGCTATATATVTVDNTPIAPTITSQPPNCSAAGTSTISNYNAAHTYVFNPTGPTISGTGLISGMIIGTSYTVTVAANIICPPVTSASFSNAAVLVTPAVPTISTTPPTCSVAGTSTISNYNAAHTYVFTPTGPTVSGTGLISGMTIGTSYTVIASNGTCTSGASASFINAAVLVTPVVPTISTTPPTCSIAGTSTISNYNAAHTYVFTPTGPTVSGTGLISGMTIGTSYIVTASNGTCTSGASASFSNAAVLVTPAVPTISTTPPTCSIAGTSTISNYNAAHTYVFTPTGPTVSGTGLISGMVIGTSYIVTASNGTCTSGASASFSNAAVLVTPVVPTISTTPPTCSIAGTSTISNYNAAHTYVFTPTGPTVSGTGL
ncbi:hypothetical protein NAT51_09285, partial [Flavobacterium amniphilum]|nr:hypothetical protein [Flavobacterium amniphilum]